MATKTFSHRCPKCSKEWFSSVEYPVKCPGCQHKLTKHGFERVKESDAHIVVDPKICGGKPTIRGTRIMVGNILGMFAGGDSINAVLKAYPELSREDIFAALEYARKVVDEEIVIA